MKNTEYSKFVDDLQAPYRTDSVDELPLRAAVGLAGESGELLDKMKKVFWQGHPMTEAWFNETILEAGDILFYLQDLCNFLGVSLDVVQDMNVVKLKERYKSGKFTRNESVNRKNENG